MEKNHFEQGYSKIHISILDHQVTWKQELLNSIFKEEKVDFNIEKTLPEVEATSISTKEMQTKSSIPYAHLVKMK